MSWDIYLEDKNGNILKVPAHNEGGILRFDNPIQLELYQDLGEVTKCNTNAEINITWNYGKWFPFRKLNGMKAKDTIGALTYAVTIYGTKRDPDYYKPTKGNVGYCCFILFSWAKLHPEGVWRIV